MSLALSMLLVCVAIFIVGQIGGAVLAVISSMITGTEMSRGLATLIATSMLAVATVVALALSALGVGRLPGLIVLATIAFVVGVPVYAIFVIDEDEHRPISLGQAGAMSGVVTAVLSGLAAAFLW